MSFIEFEHYSVNKNSAMTAPHSHDFYELYFLLDGKRSFFINNKMFFVNENTLVVVPPYCLHKTEGEAYSRININVSPDLLTKSQNEYLMQASEKIAVKINPQYKDLIARLVNEGANLKTAHLGSKNEALLTLTQAILVILSMQNVTSVSARVSHVSEGEVSPEVLKIINYVNEHYTENVQLKDICNEFYISKAALCKKFKDVMKCSVMKYILEMRLNKAKSLLRDTGKSIEQIAQESGFSSANYFGLTFKKSIGMSPLNFRKSR